MCAPTTHASSTGIGALLDDLGRADPVDTKRISVTGMSNGAMLAYQLAAELSDCIAAIAPVSVTMVTEIGQPASVRHAALVNPGEVSDASIPNICFGEPVGSSPNPPSQDILATAYFAFWTVSFRL